MANHEIMSEFYPAGFKARPKAARVATLEAAFPPVNPTAQDVVDAAIGFVREHPHLTGAALAALTALALPEPVAAKELADEADAKINVLRFIIGGLVGGAGGATWEYFDGTSSGKFAGMTREGNPVKTHEGSSPGDLFLSGVGGTLTGASFAAAFEPNLPSWANWLAGNVGFLGGWAMMNSTKQALAFPRKR